LNWEYAGLQNLHDYLLEFCKENDCVFIDGNLLIDRYDIFSDTNSFIDDQHLSGEGATVFSKKICEIIKKIDLNEDVTGAFYSSYSEMQKASPYMSYYLSTIE
jgi:hypothetical protein